ncbi:MULTISPECIES: DUF4232 domain-containing protein [Streptomyces]|uniref:DUF4232 domain-containing protein n=1 Tax=Streptomyces evansiae TaxID=3075535 RepID=A0ABU2RA82_9ACTN|nr:MULTISPECIES: DUF4232 domain-containing protein [unclassified Streptomyces]MDT0413545.1 DUF4232 domain-containing protein [Streptomyces sp. DSM 41979]MYQ60252.1 DUF4232 domain-containing protein [Streptomyces sp. SID4926]SCE53904.1 Protein of unknown function [Streptomyces sp. DfronAA-171]
MRTTTGKTTKARRAGTTAAALAAAALLLTACGGNDTGGTDAAQKVDSQAGPLPGDQADPRASEEGGKDPSAPASPGRDASSTPSGKESTGGGGGSKTGGGTATSDPGSDAKPAASTQCHTSELSVRVGDNHPGAGQEGFALVLTNTSSRTCTVYGYPGLAFVNDAGEQVTVDPERAPGTKERVSLTPGKSAWSPLTFTNPRATGVTTITPAAIRLTPPDERDYLKAAWKGGPVSNTGKASVPRVGPFTAGTGE